MVHLEHSLVILKHGLHTSTQDVIFKRIANGKNEMWEEGERAQREGDFKEMPYLKAEQTCDVCEENTCAVRYVCLNCRQMSLCTQCYEVQLDNINNLDLDSTSSILREHQEDHLFLRVFDFHHLDLQF